MKKAQAASEFLMTYGWAILAVTLAISAFAYVGVFSNKNIIEKCQSEIGMDCIDKAVITESGVTVALRQNKGFKTQITNLTSVICNTQKGGVAGKSAQLTLNNEFIPFNVSDNDVFRLGLGCSLSKGDLYKDTVSFSYENIGTGLVHKVLVEIQGVVT